MLNLRVMNYRIDETANDTMRPINQVCLPRVPCVFNNEAPDVVIPIFRVLGRNVGHVRTLQAEMGLSLLLEARAGFRKETGSVFHWEFLNGGVLYWPLLAALGESLTMVN